MRRRERGKELTMKNAAIVVPTLLGFLSVVIVCGCSPTDTETPRVGRDEPAKAADVTSPAPAATATPVVGKEVKIPGHGTLKLAGPYTHRNLAVYYLYGGKATSKVVPITLEEGIKSGKVKITEMPDERVSQLRISNLSKWPLFVFGGELIRGGKQDRTVVKSVVVPPNTKDLPIETMCVEAGRWAGGVKFSDQGMLLGNYAQVAINPSGLATARARASGIAAMIISDNQSDFIRLPTVVAQDLESTVEVPEGGTVVTAGNDANSDAASNLQAGRGAGQGQLWRSVGAYKGALRANAASLKGGPVKRSKTTSMLEELNDKEVRELLTEYVAKSRAPARDLANPVGFAYAVDGKVVAVHVVSCNALYEKVAAKLLRSAALDALAGEAKKAPAAVDLATLMKFITTQPSGKKRIERPAAGNLLYQVGGDRRFSNVLTVDDTVIYSAAGSIIDFPPPAGNGSTPDTPPVNPGTNDAPPSR
jgi:hypothetical protein